VYRITKKTNVYLWPDTLDHPKKVRWNGRSFNRVSPNSKYYIAIFKIDGKDTSRLLHRLVYKKYNNKEIPSKYAVHHIDRNSLNNHPLNLEIISLSGHSKRHTKEKMELDPRFWEKGLLKAREEAKKWHASSDGKKWHSEQGKYTWSVRKKISKRCIRCDKIFFTYWPDKAKYCSKICGSKSWTENNPDKVKCYNNRRKEKRKKNKSNPMLD